MSDLKHDLPKSMMIAAFTGISWCLGVEINTSLFLLFKRRRGLYFSSCALCACGIILQPLFTLLANFDVWTDRIPSITAIYLTWLIMVVPQSWVLYSRLHLLMSTARILRVIRVVLVFNSVVLSVPTVLLGVFAQAINPALTPANLIWDRVQLVIFFIQETVLSVLYILQTRKYLQGRSPLHQHVWSSPSVTATTTATATTTTVTTIPGLNANASATANYPPATDEHKSMLWQLIYANILIIALDIVLLGIQCDSLFELQGSFKPCVYGIKLKVEFVILNRLREVVLRRAAGGVDLGSDPGSNGNGSSMANAGLYVSRYGHRGSNAGWRGTW
ncbi:integral membrane protein [Aspergillus egyptiacus]|nr:integral membrane protein [Aspergillus egyptiacus]